MSHLKSDGPKTGNVTTRGASRRSVMACLAWAGAGVVWTVSGGIPKSLGLGGDAIAAQAGGFSFVQISDSHIGFKGDVNPTPGVTLQQALDDIAKLPTPPAMLVHTGDVTHLSKAEEFDAADQILKGAKRDIHYVPGEHDVIGDDGTRFFARFAKDATPGGWYSFDQGGVHFVALVNVLNFKPGTGGSLGAAQIEWLEKDLHDRGASTPIVVLAHMPLWPIYPSWGWSTDDSAQAMGHLKRFGSVTVLNGHIHQVVQKVEGTVALYTARSTAFPQPPAGEGKGPGPMPIAADKLKSVLGIRQIEIVPTTAAAVKDQTLA
ncbi:MAG TPA: metallophosphoesterase [Stellaceae bacterium]|jgi:3',5'-cyclic AMP phosphodiesterase CpdA|nr:metallophosphoesterase [Stellaceae bacterium]